MNGGATWNLYDSTDNVDSSGNLLPIESTSRDRTFVGTTAYKVVVDPQLTPNGQVIIYAAMSGTNGGIWRSEDTGKTWHIDARRPGDGRGPRPGQRRGPQPGHRHHVQGNLQVVYAGPSAARASS